eukprot:366279-Chlamydomonas_euryale.AAC.20
MEVWERLGRSASEAAAAHDGVRGAMYGSVGALGEAAREAAAAPDGVRGARRGSVSVEWSDTASAATVVRGLPNQKPLAAATRNALSRWLAGTPRLIERAETARTLGKRPDTWGKQLSSGQLLEEWAIRGRACGLERGHSDGVRVDRTRARAGARLLLSGILADQAPEILEAYAADFDDFEVKTDGSWACVQAVRKRAALQRHVGTRQRHVRHFSGTCGHFKAFEWNFSGTSGHFKALEWQWSGTYEHFKVLQWHFSGTCGHFRGTCEHFWSACKARVGTLRAFLRTSKLARERLPTPVVCLIPAVATFAAGWCRLNPSLVKQTETAKCAGTIRPRTSQLHRWKGGQKLFIPVAPCLAVLNTGIPIVPIVTAPCNSAADFDSYSPSVNCLTRAQRRG